MIVVIVDTRIGIATSCAASSTAFLPIGADREVAVDVLELDDRVVDEPPDAEREPAEREDVERLAREVEEDERRDDRQRDRDRDDRRSRGSSRGRSRMTTIASAPPCTASCSSALTAARMYVD